jgi:hypothetical protein
MEHCYRIRKARGKYSTRSRWIMLRVGPRHDPPGAMLDTNLQENYPRYRRLFPAQHHPVGFQTRLDAHRVITMLPPLPECMNHSGAATMLELVRQANCGNTHFLSSLRNDFLWKSTYNRLDAPHPVWLFIRIITWYSITCFLPNVAHR